MSEVKIKVGLKAEGSLHKHQSWTEFSFTFNITGMGPDYSALVPLDYTYVLCKRSYPIQHQ